MEGDIAINVLGSAPSRIVRGPRVCSVTALGGRAGLGDRASPVARPAGV